MQKAIIIIFGIPAFIIYSLVIFTILNGDGYPFIAPVLNISECWYFSDKFMLESALWYVMLALIFLTIPLRFTKILDRQSSFQIYQYFRRLVAFMFSVLTMEFLEITMKGKVLWGLLFYVVTFAITAYPTLSKNQLINRDIIKNIKINKFIIYIFLLLVCV